MEARRIRPTDILQTYGCNMPGELYKSHKLNIEFYYVCIYNSLDPIKSELRHSTVGRDIICPVPLNETTFENNSRVEMSEGV
ncbi:hypothetical protein JCM18750_36380 [Halostagnicola bangensis]